MSKKLTSRVAFFTLLAIPFIFIFLPADFFDSGTTLCPSKRFLDIECLGCGLTRGIQHLIHLDLETALTYNKLSPIIFVTAIYFWVKLLVKYYKTGWRR